MQTPPLPQPSPQTCRNCGAGLGNSPEFCPNCGEPLRKSSARAPLSVISTISLVLGLIVFGAVGACGALFSGMTAFSFAAGVSDAEGLAGAFLIIALPCFFVGLVGFIWFLRTLIRGGKRKGRE